jgi:CheY-like chemotaxis protein
MAKILVVDDRFTNREFLLTLLGYWNHQLLEASDGREALELTRTEHPDLVIADIIMPTMDGYEFVRQLRAEQAISQTPIIFFTAGFLEPEAQQLAAACGVNYLITKPCEPQELLDKINAALDNRAPLAMPEPDQHFEQDHRRILTDKLAAKVNELEELNTALKLRVEARLGELDVGAAQNRTIILLREELRRQRATSQLQLAESQRLILGNGQVETPAGTKLNILGFILAYAAGVFTLPLIPWIRLVFHF